MKKIAILLALAAIFSGLVESSRAALIYGSGEGSNPSPGGLRDANWEIVAVPTGFTPPSGQSTPYAAYSMGLIPWNWGYAGERQWGISGAWNNAAQAGFTNNGGTAYWIAPNPGGESLTGGGGYNWIARQTFSVATEGTYSFTFYGLSDDYMSFYINGSVDSSNGTFPTITGGTQIGGSINSYNFPAQSLTGDVYLAAGTHSAYMVLSDISGFTGALIGRSSFEPASAVPEPGQVAASLLLLAGIGGYVAMKRRRAVKPAKATC